MVVNGCKWSYYLRPESPKKDWLKPVLLRVLTSLRVWKLILASEYYSQGMPLASTIMTDRDNQLISGLISKS